MKNGLVPLSGLLLAALLSGCAGQQVTWGQGPSPDPTPTNTATPAPEENQEPTTLEEANDLITVDAPPSLRDWNYPARYTTLVKQEKFGTETIDDQEIPVLKMGSLQGNDEVLDTTAWPDATGPALIENSARGVVVATLVYADTCAMDAVGLQSVVFHTAFGDVSVLGNNPWLAEYFPTDPKKINDWGGAAVNGNDEERLEAAKLCAHVGALWEQLTDMGVMNITTELNYHVKPADSIKITFGAPFTTAREFELNPVQYTDSFVVLEFVMKGQPSVCENRILKNPGDGRFARPYCPPPPTVEEDCVNGCVVIEECPEGQVRNEYGKCVVEKDESPEDYVYAPYTPPAPVTPVQPAPPEVITVIPDDDTTDESAESDGTVSE